MKGVRTRVLVAAVSLATIAGGAVGATVFSAGASDAASSSAAAAAPQGPGPGGGRFHPNESATHEKGESAAREAQENAGQFPTVP